MVRGGKRKGAGRKPAWKHSPTQAIRVPKVFAERLLEIARKLDGGETLEFVSTSERTHNEDIESVSSSEVQSSDYAKQLELLDASSVVSSRVSGLQPHTARALSQRLQVPETTLKRHRQKMSSLDFAYWTSQRDPERLGWEYDFGKKVYLHVQIEPVSSS